MGKLLLQQKMLQNNNLLRGLITKDLLPQNLTDIPLQLFNFV